MSREVVRHGIFVASPNDLADERSAAIEAIVRWNAAHWEDGLVFTPLIWSLSAVADAEADRPQDAISQQLLSKASCLIAMFKHRLGTPTGDSRSGTCEELDQALARTDFPTAVYFSSEAIPKKLAHEAVRLEEWRESVTGLALDFQNLDDLRVKLGTQLDSWAGELPRKTGQTGLVEEMQAAEGYHEWLLACNPERKPCTLLLYNMELETLRTSELFETYWSNLNGEKHVRKVAFLLQPHKYRRLRRYLRDWKSDSVANQLRDRLFVAEVSPSPRDRIASSTAFCLLREGSDPSRGNPFPGARVYSLSEPFSEPRPSTQEADVIWRYRHSFVTRNEDVLESLVRIWDGCFAPGSLKSFVEISDSTELVEVEQLGIDTAEAPTGEDQLETVRTLRERLFDPNVPSYLLDPNYYILDWNPAFEMVFPTDAFYRREHVQEFVRQLTNSGEVVQRGAQFERREFKRAFDMEPLHYCSPKYRNMQFNKMASRVDDPITGKAIGWIVALHVNHVEAFDVYEADLKAYNEEHSLTSVYAQPYCKIVSRFPPYLDLVKRHVAALSSADDILDCGCGSGVLTEHLLRAGKRVTAVDCNDTMLKLAKERFDALPEQQRQRLSLVKVNVDSLHRPNVNYSQDRIGIHEGYDGVAFLNAFHPLANPEPTLNRVRTELLGKNCTLALSLPAPDGNLDRLLREFQEFSRNEVKAGRERPWTDAEWRTFADVNGQLDDDRILCRHSFNYERVLRDAGFRIVDTQPCYCDQGLFLVAEAE
jgi:SAM-dependent methyltransferase